MNRIIVGLDLKGQVVSCRTTTEGRKECFVRPGEVGSFSIHHCSVERRLRRWKCWTYEFNLALRDDYNSKYTYQLENCTEKETIMQEIINENVVCKQIDSIPGRG